MATLGSLQSRLGPLQAARAPSLWLRARQVVWLAPPAAITPVAAPLDAQATLPGPIMPVLVTDTPSEWLQRPTDDPPMTEELLRVLRASGGL
jgi:hypothetical protein